MKPAITSFTGPFRFLSNFYPSPVVYEGSEYATVEHAFQAAKSPYSAVRRAIQNASSPGQAKRLGRTVKIVPDWNERRVRVMEILLRRKFQNYQLRQLLISTGDAKLVEGNYWGDTFWGVCNGAGLNTLGELLMKLRNEFTT